MQKISNIVYFNLSGYRFRMLHLNIKNRGETSWISSMGRSDEVVMSKVVRDSGVASSWVVPVGL